MRIDLCSSWNWLVSKGCSTTTKKQRYKHRMRPMSRFLRKVATKWICRLKYCKALCVFWRLWRNEISGSFPKRSGNLGDLSLAGVSISEALKDFCFLHSTGAGTFLSPGVGWSEGFAENFWRRLGVHLIDFSGALRLMCKRTDTRKIVDCFYYLALSVLLAEFTLENIAWRKHLEGSPQDSGFMF